MHLRAGSGHGNPKIFGRVATQTPLSKFLNLPMVWRKSLYLHPDSYTSCINDIYNAATIY